LTPALACDTHRAFHPLRLETAMTDKTTSPQTQDNAAETASKPATKETVRKQVLRIASNVRAGGLRGDAGPLNADGGDGDGDPGKDI
jgi:hypothetical protein